MKYTVEGYSQQRLCELGLGLVEAHLLRWFADFAHTGKMRERVSQDGKRVWWVRYPSVIADLPIIGIQDKEALADRFRRLVNAGVLIHEHVKEGGRFSYYGFGLQYETLVFDTDHPVEEPEGYRSDNRKGTGPTTGTNDSSTTNDTSTNTTSSVAVAPVARNGHRKRTDKEVEVFKRAGALFEEHGGMWAVGGKEAKHLWALIDTAKREAPETWDTLLAGMMGTYLQMCEGTIAGKAWWKGHGYSPSKLRAVWHDVWQIAKTSQPVDAEAYARESLEAVK